MTMTAEPPQTPPSTDHDSTDTREAADLLDDNGEIDLSKVHSITKRGIANSDVSPQQCRRWRRVVGAGTQPRNVEADFDHDSVRYHATGECNHDHAEPPARYDHDADRWVTDE